MRKITYTVNFAFISSNESSNDLEKEIFIKYLKKIAIESNLGEISNSNEDPLEFLIIFKEIPIRIRVYSSNSFNNIRDQYAKIPNIDVVVIVFNILNLDLINSLNTQFFEELISEFSFTNGISVLAGVNLEDDTSNEKVHISRESIIKKAKEFEVLYTYEIRKNEEDISQLFEKILNDFILKFHYSSPELFELAKLYGKELLERS
ncbi:MAG: hypothetical protein EU535_00110 [Promethearchaeota archaeon]|nr:MAG: hypothetical protein EU535_00110 [Candidatus Lokiarchaeota archaeon]